MIMKRYIPALITLLIVSACADQDKTEQFNEANIDDFKSYEIDIEIEAERIQDFIEEVEVIGLEETDEALLSFVSEAILTANYFVIKSGPNGDLFVYSREGVFQNKINRSGNGPEEYASIGDMWTEGDHIVIFDNRNQRIVKYDLNGNFISGKKINHLGSHILPYQDGYVLDMSNALVEDTLKYNLLFVDADFNKISVASPYEHPKPGGLVWGINSLAKYKDHVIFRHTFGDTVYALKNYEPVPLFSLDFGDNWLWKQKDTYTNRQKERELMSANMLKSFFTKVSETQVLFNTIPGHGTFLLDRESGAYQRFDFKKKENGNFLVNAFGWHDGKMLFSTSSADIAELLADIPTENVSFAQGNSLEKIESSENPVLMWVKFKN